jgi:release factor glutamine methyltransferase
MEVAAVPDQENEPSDVTVGPLLGREVLSVAGALQWGAHRLSTIADRPHLEAERLLAAALIVDRTVLHAHPEAPLRRAQARVYIDAVSRREEGTPLPHILGRVEFFGLEFVVNRHVLIPRPETELLVEWALDDLRRRTARSSPGKGMPVVVDVGTGSGCIAIALAVSLPALRVIAIDISAPALAVAHINGLRHGVQARVRWVQGDLLMPIGAAVDVIVSNPPYVSEREWEALSASVRQEPQLALLAGCEGLAAIRRLLDLARLRLAPDGLLLVEIGSDQGHAAQALACAAFPDSDVEILPDLAGRDRLLAVRR